ncbi:MAG: hypothetical protein U0R50_01915 [Gaiellales bacterium]
MSSTGRVRGVVVQGVTVAAIAATAIGWIAVAGAPTASVIRRSFDGLVPELVTELIVLLVVAGVAGRLLRDSGRRLPVSASRVAARVRSAALAVSPAILVAVVVALAAVFRITLGAANHHPKVLGDELVYTGIAKGWAFDGGPLLRGANDIGHSTLFPLLIAPLFRISSTAADALAAVRAVDATLMALTAVPAYVLARRVVPREWALGVAALSAFVPWTAYAALTMTESLFYVAFVGFAALLVWTFEQPSPGRQAATAAALVALVGVRAQGLAIAAGVVLAIVLHGAIARDVRGTLRRFAPTLGLIALGAAAAVGARAAGIVAPTSSYNAVFESFSQVGRMLEWGAWSLAAFGLALGVVALAALPVAIGGMLAPGAQVAARATAVVTTALGLALLGSVALLGASPFGLQTLHERSLFYVTPLVLTCFAHWLAGGLRRPRSIATGSALATVGLVALLPGHIVEGSNDIDSPSSAFFVELDRQLPSLSIRLVSLTFVAIGCGTFLLARRSLFPLLSVVVAFAAITASVDYRDELTADQARRLGWVDLALPAGAEAALVYLGVPYSVVECGAAASAEQQDATIWAEAFNLHTRRVYHLYQPNPRDGLASPELTVGDGGVVLRDGRPFEPAYVVLDSRQSIVGEPMTRFDLASLESPFQAGASLTLWRVEAPLRIYPRPEPLPPRGDGRGC